MSFLSSLDISKNALSAQRLRMDVITQNIANAETTRTEDGGPYVRQLVVFEERKSFDTHLSEQSNKLKFSSDTSQSILEANSRLDNFIEQANTMHYEGVTVDAVIKDDTPLTPIYDPSHPDANEDGYVLMPNVNRTEENLDLMAATQSYNANITALNAIKSMASKALSIGK